MSTPEPPPCPPAEKIATTDGLIFSTTATRFASASRMRLSMVWASPVTTSAAPNIKTAAAIAGNNRIGDWLGRIIGSFSSDLQFIRKNLFYSRNMDKRDRYLLLSTRYERINNG